MSDYCSVQSHDKLTTLEHDVEKDQHCVKKDSKINLGQFIILFKLVLSAKGDKPCALELDSDGTDLLTPSQ